MTSAKPAHLVSPLVRLIQAAVCATISWFMWAKLGKHHAAIAIAVVGSLVLVIGLVAPRLLIPVDRGVMRFAKAVGTAMTWLTLVPFFWLCMVPGRLVLLALGRDPMRRAWDPSAKTYWTPKLKRSGGPHAQF